MTDHLGNVRAVVDITDTGEDVADVMELVLEQNDYRPFGERIDDERMEADGDNRYRFAGKEEQTFLNGTYSDFGARFYSSDIQRWTTPDPLAEKYYYLSPYAFCNNNPVNFVDPYGMYWYEDDAGNAMWIDCSTEVHVDSTGREWKNIGPEYLFFNGQYLFTSNNLKFISMKLYLEDLTKTGILYTQKNNKAYQMSDQYQKAYIMLIHKRFNHIGKQIQLM